MSKAPDVNHRCESCSNSISSCGYCWKVPAVIRGYSVLFVYGYESSVVSSDCLELLMWSLSVHEPKFCCLFVLKCVFHCVNLHGCVFHVGHPMGTKRAVCAPSGAEMYTSDNRRLQSSIGAAFLIVPHVQ